MKKIYLAAMLCLLVCAGAMTVACDVLPTLPAPAVEDAGPTSTPLPTSSAKEYPTVDDRSCLIATQVPLRVDDPQGDLLAWQPDTSNLTFVGPAANSNWFGGRLRLTSGPDYATASDLAADALVFGDLSWSPAGDRLAFAALRLSDSVYTVMTISAEGGAAQDWLAGEAAHTEEGSGSSQKAILAWQSNDRLRVLSACGPDCDEILQIDLSNGQVSQVGEQIRRAADRLDPTTHVPIYDEASYPYMLTPNWSPDMSKVAYIDEDDRTMVLLVKEKVQFILAIDNNTNTPRETKWADDNRTLAVRTDDVIYLFDTQCQ